MKERDINLPRLLTVAQKIALCLEVFFKFRLSEEECITNRFDQCAFPIPIPARNPVDPRVERHSNPLPMIP